MSSRANAAKNSSALSKPAFAATASSFSAVCPRRASSRSTSARPCATVASCCCALNHWRTFARARLLCTYPSSALSQSRDGPPCLVVMTSTCWPFGEPVVERHHLAVDLRAAAAVPESRVHRIREVDRRRAARQVDDLALRRQHVDRVGEEALLERRQPLARVRDGVLPVEHLPQPRDLLVERRVVAHAVPAAFLVAPVRGDAVLRVLVHLPRADLHLERLVAGPDDRRVQRPVVVGLRLRDVVVELARQRRPQVVHDAERRVAILHGVDEDAHGADVVQRVDARLLALHLAADAVDVLRPPGDLRRGAGRGEFRLQRRDDVADVALRGRAGARRASARSPCTSRARARAGTGPRAPTSAARRRGDWRAARRGRAPRARPACASRRRRSSARAAPACARRA